MRYGSVVAMFLIACSAGSAAAAQAISYTEPHETGSAVALTQGIWDCGDMADDKATRVMADMAHAPERQEAIGREAGCSRTLDLDRIDEPWHVVRRLGALCEDRTREQGEIVLPGGARRARTYVVCGREAHALLVARGDARRTVIDVLDLSSYD